MGATFIIEQLTDSYPDLIQTYIPQLLFQISLHQEQQNKTGW